MSTAPDLPVASVDSSAQQAAALHASTDNSSRHDTAQSQAQQQAVLAATAPSVTFDFSQFKPQTTSYTFKVTIRYNQGSFALDEPIEVLPNTGSQAVATLLYNTIPVATKNSDGTWDPGFQSVTLNGSVVNVSGYWVDAKGNFSAITGRNSSVKGYDITIGGGYSPGSSTESPSSTHVSKSSPQQTSGSEVAFNFAPSEIDGTASLQENATLTATIDGVMVQLSESAGETYLQVASDLYQALVAQGLSGVSNDGNGDVILTNDFAGQPVSTLGIQLADTTGDPVDWIDTGVGQYPLI